MDARILTISLSLPSVVNGLAFSLFPQTRSNPALHKYASAQSGTPLDIRMIIGRENESQMAVTGLQLELDHEHPNYDRPLMPGVDGPHPNLSSGVRALHVVENPFFVGVAGVQRVELLNGCWEMVWREGAQAGSIICGFDVPTESKRNDATLPSGRLYMNFPIFTKDSLEESRQYKLKVEKKAEGYLRERDDAMAKMEITPNPLLKALHYRTAFAAAINYSETGVRQLTEWDMDDVREIEGDIMLCSKGTVWTKDGSFYRGDHALLGRASVVGLNLSN